MCEIDKGCILSGKELVRFNQRELPEMVPDVFGLALVEESLAVGREIDGIVEVAVTDLGSGFAYWQKGNGMVCIGLAPGL